MTTTTERPVTRRGTLHALGYSITLAPRTLADVARGRARHPGLGLLLGLVGVVELGLLVLFVARGVLYGVVDDGPYTDAWGGPTLVGAWAAHFAVGLAMVAVSVGLGSAVTTLHRHLDGPGARWARPVSLGLGLAALAFFALWLRQF